MKIMEKKIKKEEKIYSETNEKSNISNYNSEKLYSKRKNNFIDESDIYNKAKKQKIKPKVNVHEFEEIIRAYRKNNRMNDSKITNEDNKNDSFRKSTSDIKDKDRSKIINADSKTRLVYDSDSNFQLAFKERNKRPKKEIQDFMKKKDEVRKENEIKESQDIKKKNYDNFRNIAKLQESIDNNKKKINLQKLRNRVKNGYYIGKDKNALSKSSSRSTIYDQNELYKILIESKQIIASGNRESDNEDIRMSKEDYDKFINEQVNNIKTGNFGSNNEYISDNDDYNNNNLRYNIDDNEERKNNNKMKSSLVRNAEESIEKSKNIVKQNNLEQHLNNKNNKKNQNNFPENINNNVNKIQTKKKENPKQDNLNNINVDSKKYPINNTMETKANTLPQPSNQQSNKNSINPELNNVLPKNKNDDIENINDDNIKNKQIEDEKKKK